MTDRSRMLPAPGAGDLDAPPSRFDDRLPPPGGYEPLTAPPGSGAGTTRIQDDRRRARSRGMAGLLAVLASLALFLLLFLSLPNEISHYWPQASGVYNMLGIEVNKRGFRIVATQTQEIANSIPIIVIKGQVINETDREREVPPIRLAVRDRAGRELHSWIVRADQDKVGPQAEGTFSARLESPPRGTYDLEVRFVREGER